MSDLLLLIDGNNLVFRAYYAFERQGLRTRTGQHTGALFGFARMLLKLLRDLDPSHAAVAFDVSRDTFRKKMYPDYKAQRRPTPADLLTQLPLAHELVLAMGLPLLKHDDYEADDVIGTAAAEARQRMPVHILTGDRDLLQLLAENVTVELCVKGISETRKFDVAAFASEYGFPPGNLPDLKGLMGDTSDNIPGIRGIGEKKATPLVQKYRNLETLYERLVEVANPRMNEQLATGKADAMLSRDLATIRCDVPGIDVAQGCRWRGLEPARDRVRPMLLAWEFGSLVRELDAQWGGPPAPTAQPGVVQSIARFAAPPVAPVSPAQPAVRMTLPPAAPAPAQPVATGVAAPANAPEIAAPPVDFSQPHRTGNLFDLPDERQSPALAAQRHPASAWAESAATASSAPLPASPDANAAVASPASEGEGSAAAGVSASDGAAVGRLTYNVRCISSVTELHDFLARPENELLAVDLETSGLDPFADQIVGVALAFDERGGIYVPLAHAGLDFSPNLEAAAVWPILRSAMATRPLVGHNLKFDLQFLGRQGVVTAGELTDTHLLAYVGNPLRDNGLKDLGRALLGVELCDYADLVKKKGRKTIVEVPPEEAATYAVQDVVLPHRLLPLLHDEVMRTGLIVLYRNLEQPLIRLLLQMEAQGIGLDTTHLAALGARLGTELVRLEARIHELAGVPFNVNSPKQLQEILFNKLQLPAGRKTRTGASTDVEVLIGLRDHHPIAGELIQYRELAKLKSTYVEALVKLRNPHTGLIHTTFNQTVTSTGRLSSSNPNLQNIPIKTQWGREVRRGLTPPRPGNLFVSLDYSQIELRLLAHVTRDPVLVDAFLHNRDIHALTAAKIFGGEPGAVTSEQRKVGKTVNFGILYGISAHGLAQDLGIARPQAQNYIDGFFATFPTVSAWLAQNLERAEATGRVETLFGRVRPMPELTAGNRNTRAFGERVVRNTPLQGSAADLVKKAMIETDRVLKTGGYATRPVLQIHDELVFDVPPAEVATVAAVLKKTMENVAQLAVPLVCDVSVGPNLADLADFASA